MRRKLAAVRSFNSSCFISSSVMRVAEDDDDDDDKVSSKLSNVDKDGEADLDLFRFHPLGSSPPSSTYSCISSSVIKSKTSYKLYSKTSAFPSSPTTRTRSTGIPSCPVWVLVVVLLLSFGSESFPSLVVVVVNFFSLPIMAHPAGF